MKFPIIALAVIFSPNVFAVKTADCPASIKVELAQPTLSRSAEQVIQVLEQGQSLDEDDKDNIRASVEKTRATGNVTRLFALVKAKNGRCQYGHNRHNFDGAEIYTKRDANGEKVDRMLIEIPVGPKGVVIRHYAVVQTFGSTEVKIQNNESSVALAIPRTPYDHYSAGGPVIFVGKSNPVSVTAGR